MFGPLQTKALLFEKENLTYNYHHDGVLPSKFETDEGLALIFKPTSYSTDGNGTVFVASMEGHHYPFYGVQFHPEKPIASFGTFFNGLDHSRENIELNRYFGDFFVSEARKNFNQFESYQSEVAALIENYDRLVTENGVQYLF